MIVECARAGTAIEILFDAWLTIGGKQCLLLGEEIGVAISGRFQNAMTFGDFCEDGVGQRIGLMKGEEVEAFFFFPMRKAAAVANVDFAVTWR